ncbi:O-antigen polymerase [Acinetobacter guillouiae]|uniref:O-antigen polymerase n=1 Tax=Acinetobacter guillouiae TaxID=106649 RepID=UPI003AF87BE2
MMLIFNRNKLFNCVFNILFCFVSVVFYINAPINYSFLFCLSILILFTFQNIIYFLLNKEGVGFESLFMISFLMCNFIYPVFYYGNSSYVSMFVFGFNENIISKSTSLAFLGYSFYLLGITNYVKRDSFYMQIKNSNIVVSKNIFVLVFLSSFLSFSFFVLAGGLQQLKEIYNGSGAQWGETGLFSYISIFSTLYTILLSALVFLINDKLIRWGAIVYILVVAFLMLSTGSRTIPISLILILLVSYSFFIKKISLPLLLISIFLGANLMYFLVLFRELGMDRANSFDNAFSLYKNSNSFFDIFMDLISNNRNLYVLTDFVDNFETVGFLNVLTEILSVVPGSGFLNKYFTIPDFMVAGQLPTYLQFGSGSLYGLGTNMVGESYLSYGFWGVICIFYFLGVLIRFVKNRASQSIYFLVIFFILVGNSLFMPRADYLYSLRMYFWISIFLFFTTFLVKKVLKLR